MRLRPLALAVALVILSPFSVDAQPPTAVPRIGYLSFRAGHSHRDEVFRQGLRELGYVEGQNIAIEYRFAQGKPDRLPALAGELVRLKVDVIVTAGELPIRAAKQATSTIPIVMAASPDPVGTGLVASLARPGGNVTGLTTLSTELGGKRLELLREVVPQLARVAVLAYAADRGTASFLRELEAPARGLQIQLQPLPVQGPGDLDGAFSTMTRERVGALVMPNHPFFTEHRRRIVELAAKSRLPTLHAHREFVDTGGLMSYGPNLSGLFHRAATFVDKILKGAKPADLPVEQPTRFELVINLKTARALGLTIPQSVLILADQVIQ